MTAWFCDSIQQRASCIKPYWSCPYMGVMKLLYSVEINCYEMFFRKTIHYLLKRPPALMTAVPFDTLIKIQFFTNPRGRKSAFHLNKHDLFFYRYKLTWCVTVSKGVRPQLRMQYQKIRTIADFSDFIQPARLELLKCWTISSKMRIWRLVNILVVTVNVEIICVYMFKRTAGGRWFWHLF